MIIQRKNIFLILYNLKTKSKMEEPFNLQGLIVVTHGHVDKVEFDLYIYITSYNYKRNLLTNSF